MELGGDQLRIVLRGGGELDEDDQVAVGDEVQAHVRARFKGIFRIDDPGHQVA